MNPTKLAEVAAGLTIDSKHLAIEGHLVDARRIQVADEQHRIRPGCHTQGIWCARSHGAPCAVRIFSAHDNLAPCRVYRHVDGEFTNVVTIGIEHLDSAIAAIGHVDFVRG